MSARRARSPRKHPSSTPARLPLDHPEFDAMAEWYDFDYERSMRKDLSFYLRCALEGGDQPIAMMGMRSLYLSQT